MFKDNFIQLAFIDDCSLNFYIDSFKNFLHFKDTADFGSTFYLSNIIAENWAINISGVVDMQNNVAGNIKLFLRFMDIEK